MKDLNSKYGYRTFIDNFDDSSNYHEASLPHHDLSQREVLGYFRRGLKRLEYIKVNKVEILLYIQLMRLKTDIEMPSMLEK